MEKQKIDVKDQKLLSQLDVDSRQSLRQLARKIGMSEEATRYRLLRLQHKGIVTRFHAYLDYKRIGYHGYCVYCRYQTVPEEKKARVLAYLQQHDRVYWIAEYGGRFDLAFSVFAKTPDEFDTIYTEIIDACSEVITQSTFIIKLDARKYSRSYLAFTRGPSSVKKSGEIYRLSYTEARVLQHLCADSRLSATDIAQATKVPLSTVLYTIKRLEKERIIRGYTVVLQPLAIGMQSYQVNVLTHGPTQKELNSLFSYCEKNDDIIVVVKTVGAWNFEIIYEVRDAKAMQAHLVELRSLFGHIIREAELMTIFEDYLKLNHYPFKITKEEFA